MLDYVRGFGELTLKGLVAVNAPTIFKGMINQIFHQYRVTVDKVVPLVQENKSLWGTLPSELEDTFLKGARQAGNMEWLTTEWLIDAIKKEHPALASLFLSWRKARNWLGRQIEEIKEQVVR